MRSSGLIRLSAEEQTIEYDQEALRGGLVTSRRASAPHTALELEQPDEPSGALFCGRADGRLLLGRQCLEVPSIDVHAISGTAGGFSDDPARLQLSQQ